MSPLRILADANMQGVEALLAPYGEVHCIDGRALQPRELADADVLLVRSVTRVDADLLAASSVRFVGTATSGLEHIDQDYLQARGTVFAHARGANANAVVEYVLAVIAVCDNFLERLLGGGRLGIVGQGHVGRRLAACARELGIAVQAFDPWRDDVVSAAELEEVLTCDVISLHPELTTRDPWPSFHLLDAERLARIPADSLLVNASRGPVIDNAALRAHLAMGAGPTTVLDVWEGEPNPDPGLLGLAHLGSPHIAGYTEDARYGATHILARALARWLGAEPPAATAALASAPILSLGPATDALAQLRAVLLGRYDPRNDDAELRAAMDAVTRAAAARAFDRLRRDYPPRRELRGSRVVAPGLPPAWGRALGLENPEAGSDE